MHRYDVDPETAAWRSMTSDPRDPHRGQSGGEQRFFFERWIEYGPNAVAGVVVRYDGYVGPSSRTWEYEVDLPDRLSASYCRRYTRRGGAYYPAELEKPRPSYWYPRRKALLTDLSYQ